MSTFFWKPGWVETAYHESREIVTQLSARDAWVMDGNYGRTIRLAAVDTIAFLDRARWRCLSRAIGRWLRNRGRSRPDLPPGRSRYAESRRVLVLRSPP